MAQDLTVHLENRPGTLAEAGEALGNAGINIDGVCGFPCEGRGVLHFLVEDGAAARQALDAAGVEVKDVRDVLVVEVDDQPGVLGAVTGKIAAAGVNVNLTYLATQTRLVVGADDLAAAEAAL